jgi:hypothetical protein
MAVAVEGVSAHHKNRSAAIDPGLWQEGAANPGSNSAD